MATYIDLRKYFTLAGDAARAGYYNEDTFMATLTKAENSRRGAIIGSTKLSLKSNFTFKADVFLGTKRGADGIGIAFHQGSIGQQGDIGAGLGILGLPKGIGFELDSYTNADLDEKENDQSGGKDPFGHASFNTKTNREHAGFVTTDVKTTKNVTKLLAVTQMQGIAQPNGQLRTITINWNASSKTLTAIWESVVLVNGKKQTKTNNWTYKPAFDVEKNYTFIVAASTGGSNNEHRVGLREFTAAFTKPVITTAVEELAFSVGSTFDPLNYPPLELKAMDPHYGDLTKEIIVTSNTVDTAVPGEYEVTYYVENQEKESDTKTIAVTVYGAPVIHALDVSIPVGTEFDALTYPDIELHAEDALDGDITDLVELLYPDSVDVDTAGVYEVTYYVENSFGVPAEKAITVTVVGRPFIRANSVEFEVNSVDSFDPLTYEPIALYAEDGMGHDITGDVEVQFNNVDATNPGNYRVVYSVRNSAGLLAVKHIKVTVLVEDNNWEDCESGGWKHFAGQDIHPIEDCENSLNEDSCCVYYSATQAAIYKFIPLETGVPYQIIVCAKVDPNIPAHALNTKVTCKETPSGTEGVEWLNSLVTDGQPIEQGFYKLISQPMTFTVDTSDKKLAVVVELFYAGYIGSIQIVEARRR